MACLTTDLITLDQYRPETPIVQGYTVGSGYFITYYFNGKESAPLSCSLSPVGGFVTLYFSNLDPRYGINIYRSTSNPINICNSTVVYKLCATVPPPNNTRYLIISIGSPSTTYVNTTMPDWGKNGVFARTLPAPSLTGVSLSEISYSFNGLKNICNPSVTMYQGGGQQNPYTRPSYSPIPIISESTGGLTIGTYLYNVTFVMPNDNGSESAKAVYSSSIVIDHNNAAVDLACVPVSPDARVIARNIYRTKVNQTTPLYYVATISDNITTTFLDTIPDSSLSITDKYVDGTYLYKICFITQIGNHTNSTNATYTSTSNHRNVTIRVQKGSTHNAGESILETKIYRTKSGGNTFYLLYTTTSNYFDYVDYLVPLDDSTPVIPPTTNTTGYYQYKFKWANGCNASNATTSHHISAICPSGISISINGLDIYQLTDIEVYRTACDGIIFRKIVLFIDFDSGTRIVRDSCSDNNLGFDGTNTLLPLQEGCCAESLAEDLESDFYTALIGNDNHTVTAGSGNLPYYIENPVVTIGHATVSYGNIKSLDPPSFTPSCHIINIPTPTVLNATVEYDVDSTPITPEIITYRLTYYNNYGLNSSVDSLGKTKIVTVNKTPWRVILTTTDVLYDKHIWRTTSSAIWPNVVLLASIDKAVTTYTSTQSDVPLSGNVNTTTAETDYSGTYIYAWQYYTMTFNSNIADSINHTAFGPTTTMVLNSQTHRAILIDYPNITSMPAGIRYITCVRSDKNSTSVFRKIVNIPSIFSTAPILTQLEGGSMTAGSYNYKIAYNNNGVPGIPSPLSTINLSVPNNKIHAVFTKGYNDLIHWTGYHLLRYDSTSYGHWLTVASNNISNSTSVEEIIMNYFEDTGIATEETTDCLFYIDRFSGGTLPNAYNTSLSGYFKYKVETETDEGYHSCYSSYFDVSALGAHKYIGEIRIDLSAFKNSSVNKINIYRTACDDDLYKFDQTLNFSDLNFFTYAPKQLGTFRFLTTVTTCPVPIVGTLYLSYKDVNGHYGPFSPGILTYIPYVTSGIFSFVIENIPIPTNDDRIASKSIIYNPTGTSLYYELVSLSPSTTSWTYGGEVPGVAVNVPLDYTVITDNVADSALGSNLPEDNKCGVCIEHYANKPITAQRSTWAPYSSSVNTHIPLCTTSYSISIGDASSHNTHILHSAAGQIYSGCPGMFGSNMPGLWGWIETNPTTPPGSPVGSATNIWLGIDGPSICDNPHVIDITTLIPASCSATSQCGQYCNSCTGNIVGPRTFFYDGYKDGYGDYPYSWYLSCGACTLTYWDGSEYKVISPFMPNAGYVYYGYVYPLGPGQLQFAINNPGPASVFPQSIYAMGCGGATINGYTIFLSNTPSDPCLIFKGGQTVTNDITDFPGSLTSSVICV